MKPLKQVIVWRGDLKEMPLGKKMGQPAHAAHQFLSKRIIDCFGGAEAILAKADTLADQTVTIEVSKAELLWMAGDHKKVVVLVRSLSELQTVQEKAKELGLETHMITDAGHTVFKEPTVTCLSIGPDYDEEIDKVTGDAGPFGRLRLV